MKLLMKVALTFGKVDFAESDLALKRGHSYSVTMNDAQASPRIVSVIEEVEEDLGPLLAALRSIGYPASAREVAEALARSGTDMKVDAVKRRLDRLVEDSAGVTRLRSATRGRAHVYAIGGSD